MASRPLFLPSQQATMAVMECGRKSGIDTSAGVSRRTFVLAALGTTAVSVVGCKAASSKSGTVGAPATDGRGLRALPIPALAESTLSNGERRFALTARAGTTEIKSGVGTDTWGYSQSILGPTLRARRGESVRVEVENRLPEATTVHWHGMHLPAVHDGGPHQPIEPNATWSPSWIINQQAATLWYHPHPHGKTGLHAYRGLAGFFIIDDDNPTAVELPRDYGIDDIPIVLQDRRFLGDGQLDESDLPDLGLLGDTVTVNGWNGVYLDAKRSRIRLRILNGSTMRVFNVAFADDRQYQIVASDGGYLEKPKPATSVIVSPGERVEIVVEIAAGETVKLQAKPIRGNLDVDDRDAPDFGLADQFDLIELRGSHIEIAHAGMLPAVLNPSLAEPPVQGTITREFDLQWFMINGTRMDMSKADQIVAVDQWEVWTISNKDNWIHNFHVHDAQFRVIDVTGTRSPMLTDGWKDTVLLSPGAVVRIAVRFTDYTDTRWPYMYHCHLMFHEDQGMMGQFLVVEPGGVPDTLIGTEEGFQHGQSTMPATSDHSGMERIPYGGN
ncbi:multicopper oxidase domain-containing protein [Mycolicibacterium sediminis]|uniref:Multicopper oxidase n=3 Tax=Mycolicibacterium sediminis TaxID=1286180 RepID=A0A7I7QZ27_9MYCO|nr:multicopper oxidase [Mycolicibacterium sediminis]